MENKQEASLPDMNRKIETEPMEEHDGDVATGAKIGGVGGAVTGLIAGSMLGPLGALLGAAVGGTAGSLGSGAAVSMIERNSDDPTDEMDENWPSENDNVATADRHRVGDTAGIGMTAAGIMPSADQEEAKMALETDGPVGHMPHLTGEYSRNGNPIQMSPYPPVEPSLQANRDMADISPDEDASDEDSGYDKDLK